MLNFAHRHFFSIVLISSFSHFSETAFSQNKSVDALKENQEIRKKYIDFTPSTSKNSSKSLFVDPFIGTGGHGHTYPGASAPFGMMQLSPDTRYDGWDGCSGYHYSDSIIYGFSHTHLSGTGVPDYCDLLLVPQSGTPKTTPGYLDPKGFGDKFSHKQENASPGFYEVKLLNQQINVRLTVSDRAGMHEYTFLNKKGKKFILIDLDHRDKLLGYTLTSKDKKSVSGSRISNSWAKEQHFYFRLELNVPYQKATYFTKNGQHKLLLTFPESTEQILVKVGMSAVDEDGAKKNLDAEIKDWNFDGLRAETVQKWNKELGKINFQTKDKATMINFYTALYHSYLNPNVFSDVDLRYRGMDNNIHYLENENSKQYTVFSLWDTYRATHPLFTITQQKRTKDFIETFLRQFMQSLDLPVWELAGNETDCMIGYHSVSVIADAYTKGINDFNTELAIKAMIRTSDINEHGKFHYYTNGFISVNDDPESVSKTLEYAYDDFCISQFAKAINQTAVSDYFLKRSFNFINVYDPKTKFMRARRSGTWFSPFDPSEVNFNYTEANSWQYSLYAPHAVGVLSQLIGGKDSLENWLDKLFTTKSQLSGRDQVDITGLIGQYAHGNEPSHHMAYLYNYTNSPEKTQFYVDKILKEMYSATPDGLSGNEDCGQMSSWYVLSALGIYQIAPGSPYYDFGRPIMDEASIELENGKRFTFKVLNNSPESKYIQKITLNGKPIYRTYLHHDEILSGGGIEFTMGKTPLLEKGKIVSTPTLNEISDEFVPVPYFTNENLVFDDSIRVQIDHPAKNLNNGTYTISYSYDEINWMPYSKPIILKETTHLYSKLTKKAENGNTYESANISTSFTKKDKEVHLKLFSEYANQYAAGGQTALIDGIRGGTEFRTGDWQGYFAQDLIAEVSFDTPRSLSTVGISCIQDMKSWIFYPSSIKIEISFDGENFQLLNSNISIPEYTDYSNPSKLEFTTKTNTSEQIKKIRITAKNYGKCPQWHLGAGNDTWLFADEILFR